MRVATGSGDKKLGNGGDVFTGSCDLHAQNRTEHFWAAGVAGVTTSNHYYAVSTPLTITLVASDIFDEDNLADIATDWLIDYLETAPIARPLP